MLQQRNIVLGFAMVAGLFATAAVAQDAQGPGTAPQTSNAVVAHLSAMQGSVSTQRGDNTGTWDTGALNAPLVSGDKVATGADGRAEVQIDYGDLLRLAANSQANLVTLDNSQIQTQLASGTADYVVLKGAQATAEIDTPNISIRPDGPGVYRIEVVSDSETRVIVRKGKADISTPQGSTTLQEGQLITVDGTDAPQYKIGDAPDQDAWDQWNKDRDNKIEASASLHNTSPYYAGAQDLDGYGYWTYVPGYGQVWVPNEGPAWTPYSDGQWLYEPYWGWTWAGYEPWGWAPYHYGRWMVIHDRWGWWPGPVTPYYRPVWAPAYVSFFGWGHGVGFGFGFGSIGWMPIGPCDPFRPWWGFGVHIGFEFGHPWGALAVGGRGRAVYSNLNGWRENARIRDAMVRVPSNEFGHGRVATHERVGIADMGRGQEIQDHLPMTTGRASLSVGRPVTNERALPQHTATRFFGTHAATGEARPGFTPGFTQERAGVQTGVRATPSGGREVGGGASAGANAGGWTRFGADPGARSEPRPAGVDRGVSQGTSMSRPAESEARPGFQRFTPQPGDVRGSDGRYRSPAPSPAERGGYGNERSYPSAPAYRGGDSRPPLQVGHPIVRSAEPSARPSYGGGRPSAPSGGGHVESRPSGGGGGRPSGGGGGGGSHGGGGHSHR